MDEKTTAEAIAMAWHEYTYPRAVLEGPPDRFQRAIRVALEVAEAHQAKQSRQS